MEMEWEKRVKGGGVKGDFTVSIIGE